MERAYEIQAVYETTSGDRVAIFQLDGEWFINWSYATPFTSTPQLVGYGNAEPKAVDVFVQSRERESIAFDSRTDWVRGSI